MPFHGSCRIETLSHTKRVGKNRIDANARQKICQRLEWPGASQSCQSEGLFVHARRHTLRTLPDIAVPLKSEKPFLIINNGRFRFDPVFFKAIAGYNKGIPGRAGVQYKFQLDVDIQWAALASPAYAVNAPSMGNGSRKPLHNRVTDKGKDI